MLMLERKDIGKTLHAEDVDGRPIYAPHHVCADCHHRLSDELQAEYRPAPVEGARFRLRVWCGLCRRESWRGNTPDQRPRRALDPGGRWLSPEDRQEYYDDQWAEEDRVWALGGSYIDDERGRK